MRDAIEWPPLWPRVLDAEFGQPPPGEYRMTAEDFQVEEVLGFAPEGSGEHLWLWIEKRNLTTAMVARELARVCEVSLRDIGYAGMKDRIALTGQWFSVHLPGREAPEDLAERMQGLEVTLLEQRRHPRKLKRGVHRANRFRLRVIGQAAVDGGLQARWQRLLAQGVANYFGPQRFGPHGRNLQRAIAVLERGWRKRDDRDGMLLSAARSYLFNQQLAARVEEGSWTRPLSGDVVMLDGSESQFVVEPDADAVAELAERADRLDLHPTGVLWGAGESRALGAAAEGEVRLVQRYPALCQGLVAAGVRLARRPLRVRLGEAILSLEEDQAWLEFSLPTGAFATSVLRELIEHPSLGHQSPEQSAPQRTQPLTQSFSQSGGSSDASTAAVQ
jgi:tRNA pseudouridine13 synthase